tara:strand:+ start:18 stop:449 length:432 start_codon:yes stop_codon:yes gene_type:complete
LLNIDIKKLDDMAIVPSKNNTSDAGWDLYSLEDKEINRSRRATIATGIAMSIPEGYVGLIWPRSGLAVKQGVAIFAGVIDSGYRGEIKVCLYNASNDSFPLKISAGDRIAQILFQEVPDFSLTVVDSLGTTERGGDGFGSSGK